MSATIPSRMKVGPKGKPEVKDRRTCIWHLSLRDAATFGDIDAREESTDMKKTDRMQGMPSPPTTRRSSHVDCYTKKDRRSNGSLDSTGTATVCSSLVRCPPSHDSSEAGVVLTNVCWVSGSGVVLRVVCVGCCCALCGWMLLT